VSEVLVVIGFAVLSVHLSVTTTIFKFLILSGSDTILLCITLTVEVEHVFSTFVIFFSMIVVFVMCEIISVFSVL